MQDGSAADFFKKDKKFYVNTACWNCTAQDFELAYTFGVYPLQRYLVPLAGGRLQSLVVAWDSRDQAHKGQRWFDLYPDQHIKPEDPLHWTGRNQTWNYMCAECHSTNLRKNYDLATDRYATKWSEINVSCETCHGPGSEHVAWAQNNKNVSNLDKAIKGLIVNLKPANGLWSIFESNPATMHWKGEPRSKVEVETCAPCHSRRLAVVVAAARDAARRRRIERVASRIQRGDRAASTSSGLRRERSESLSPYATRRVLVPTTV